MTRAKYLPDWFSEIVKRTGAHFMCMLSKGAKEGIPLKPEAKPEWERIAKECVREGKLVPVRKFFKELGLE